MLELKNINYTICDNKTKTEILKNVSFVFDDAKTYAITGHNGSGKSTLAKIIMGIITPTSGQVIYNNKDITALDATERAKLGLSFAFQQPVKFKGLTVKDILALASPTTASQDDYCKILSTVGLCARDYLDRELNSKLSGGELKRIEIATAVARNSKINIFDEPEAGIDIWSFSSLIDIFKTLQKRKATNIIISHQEKLLETADEIILLSEGKIAGSGTPSKMLPKINPSVCERLRRNNGK